MMPWFLITLLLSFTIIPISESSSNHKNPPTIPTAVVAGSVYCDTADTCLQQGLSEFSHFISGATVSIQCKNFGSGMDFHRKARTNKHGRFRFRLPADATEDVLQRVDDACLVKLVGSSDPKCSVLSPTSSSTSLRLKSTKHGFLHTFSAGTLSFKPTRSCDEKKIENPFYPPIPFFPPPPLIPVPPIPGLTPPPPVIPLPPVPGLGPPPPTPIIPLPPVPGLAPPPPAPIFPLPPVFTPPPLAPAFPLPPIPGFTPPPPPPPPVPVFPFPPLPFVPPPSSPGVPPAPISDDNATSP